MTRIRISGLWLWITLAAALTGCLIKLCIPLGAIKWYQLRYFTTLSNLLAVISFGYTLVRGRTRTPLWLKGAALMALLVTGITYHLLLVDTFGGYIPLTLGWLGNLLVHTVTPALAVLDWLLFEPRGQLNWRHPLCWALFPWSYVAATAAVAKTGLCFPGSNTPYPYPFLDVWSLGWTGALRNVGMLSAAFLALGYGLVFLDRLAAKRTCGG